MSTMLTTITARTALATTAALMAGGALAAAPAQAGEAHPAPVTAQAATAYSAPAAAKTTVVSRADVDGDGRRDKVTLKRTTIKGQTGVVLRVTTAKGVTATKNIVTQNAVRQGQSVFFGAADLNDRRGKDIVVRSNFGSDRDGFTVYSLVGKSLVAQVAPGGSSNPDDPTMWETFRSPGYRSGYTAKKINGKTTVTVRFYQRDAKVRGYFKGEATTYTSVKGAWKRTATSTVRVKATDPRVKAAYGWHAQGLPVA